VNSGCPLYVAHSLKADGFDASEDGTGRGTPIIPIAFDSKASGRNGFAVGEISPTLRSMSHKNSHQNAGGQVAVAFSENQQGALTEHEIMPSLKIGGGKPGQSYPAIRAGWKVRRLTPMECERLQGFPDGYTNIPWRGKDFAPDGPRYKSLGNSMAVNCMRWIGRRIQLLQTRRSSMTDRGTLYGLVLTALILAGHFILGVPA
jgi:DNA (cytosine-5)-methyltransferase 1